MCSVVFCKKVLLVLNLFYTLSYPWIAHGMDSDSQSSADYPPDQETVTSIERFDNDFIKWGILLGKGKHLTLQSIADFTSTNRRFSEFRKDPLFKKEVRKNHLQKLLQDLNRINHLSREEVGQLIHNQKSLTRALLQKIHQTEFSWIESTLGRGELSEEEQNKVFLGALTAKILIDGLLLTWPTSGLASQIAIQVAQDRFEDTSLNSLVVAGLYDAQVDVSQAMRNQVDTFFRDVPTSRMYWTIMEILGELSSSLHEGEQDCFVEEPQLAELESQAVEAAKTALKPIGIAAVNQTAKDNPGEIGKASCIVANLLMLHWINEHSDLFFQPAYIIGKTLTVRSDSFNRDYMRVKMKRGIDKACPPSTFLRAHPIVQEFEQFMEDLKNLLDSHSGE